MSVACPDRAVVLRARRRRKAAASAALSYVLNRTGVPDGHECQDPRRPEDEPCWAPAAVQWGRLELCGPCAYRSHIREIDFLRRQRQYFREGLAGFAAKHGHLPMSRRDAMARLVELLALRPAAAVKHRDGRLMAMPS